MKTILENQNSQNKEIVIISISKDINENKQIADKIKEEFNYSQKIEGYFKGEWIIFDFESIVLHLVIPKVKEKYNLDKLYKNKKEN